MSSWPKRQDGTNVRIGEMTSEQRRAVFKDAVEAAQRYFEKPEVRAGIAAVLASDTSKPN